MSEAKAESRAAPRRLTTVVATDICGYSRLAEADDAAAVKTVEIVYAAFKKTVLNRRGRIFHRAGDGFLAEFPSAADGVLAALEFTADIRARDTLSPNNPAARVRAGVHVGDVIEQPDGDLLGHGVNVAARLQAEAEPDGVLISLHTVNLVRGKLDVHFRRRGALTLKNIDEPVVAFDVADKKSQFEMLTAYFPRFRNARVATMIAVAFAAIAMTLAANMLTASIQPNSEFEQLKRDFLAQENEIYQLNVISGENIVFGNLTQASALQDAAVSLLESGIPDKRRAVTLLRNEKIEEAVNLLTALLENQREQNVSSEHLQTTLREIGAITFNSMMEESFKAYSELLDFNKNDVTALYQIVDLSHRTMEAIKNEEEQQEAKKREEYYIAALKNAINEQLAKEDADRDTVIKLHELRIRAQIYEGRLKLRSDKPAIEEKIQDYRQGLEILRAASKEAHDNRFYFEESLALAKTGAAKLLLSLNETGNAQDKLLRSAERDYAKAMDISYSLRDDLGIAEAQAMQGFISHLRGDYSDAIAKYEASLETRKNYRVHERIATTFKNVGQVYADMDDLTAASENFREALHIGEEKNLPHVRAMAKKELAKIHLRSNQHDQACRLLKQAQKEYSLTTVKSDKLTDELISKHNCPHTI